MTKFSHPCSNLCITLIFSQLISSETLRYFRSISAVFTPKTVRYFKRNTAPVESKYCAD